MAIRTLLGSITLLGVAFGSARSQQPSTYTPYPPPAQKSEPQTIPPTDLPTRSAPPAPEKSLDQLLDELEALRDKKAEIEKKEAELTKAILRKSERQADRMNRLGVGGTGGLVPVAPVPSVAPVPAATSSPPLSVTAPAAVPDRIGRIVIVNGKDEKKVLDLVKFVSGQVLDYPSLEAARARLEKAGYPSATVEVIPGDGGLKDVVVTVGPAK